MNAATPFPRRRCWPRVLAIVVIIMSIIVTIKAIRAGGGESTEDAPVASRRFAPAGFIATSAERDLEKQWEPILAEERRALARRGH